jgi:transposase
MHQSRTLYVGMDGHKESIAVAYVATDQDAEGISLGTLGTRQGDIAPLMRQWPSKATHLGFVSAAGPCGDGLYRSLTQQDEVCWVVTPACMPPKAGDRGTTDRRDARQLARRMRAGDLTPGSVPALDAEAIRARLRARQAPRRALQAATRRRQACVLRHDIRSTGRATGSPAHRRWLSAVGCPTPAQHSVLQADVPPVTAQTERLGRLALERHEPGNPWRLAPGGDALQAVRGVPCTVAVTPGAAWGALTRFEHPRQRLPDLGLTPSE